MAIEKFGKQNYEKFVVAGDCADVLNDGEDLILVGSIVEAVDKNGADVGTVILEQATKQLGDSPDGGTNNMLQIRCKVGTENKSPYKITFKMPTTLGNQWEVDVQMKVREL